MLFLFYLIESMDYSLSLSVLNYVVFLAVSDSSDGRKYLHKEYNASLGLFYVELPDGTVLSHTLEENEVFPAQFGREVRHFFVQ